MWLTRGGAVLLAAALFGCSADRDAEVADVAERFHAAIAGSDGQAACDLLAPSTRAELERSAGTPCAEAVLTELTGTEGQSEVAVYGDNAQAQVGDDTAFLARFSDGWLITAAGCVPPARTDQPYDCTVQGG